MTLDPLLAAPGVVQLHLIASVIALGLGTRQLWRAKGTIAHRRAGWVFVVLTAAVAGSGLFIHEARTWGPWSPIHILSVVTLLGLPVWIWAARTGRIRAHAAGMITLFVGGYLVAGLFAADPERRLGMMLFGPP